MEQAGDHQRAEQCRKEMAAEMTEHVISPAQFFRYNLPERFERESDYNELNQQLEEMDHAVKKTHEERNARRKEAFSVLLNQKELWIEDIFSFLGMGHYAFVAPVSKRISRTFYSAAFHNLACAEIWKRDNAEDKTPLSPEVCRAVAGAGSIAVLQWALANGFSLGGDSNRWICTAAAQHGHLHVLKWLHEEKGCPLNEYVWKFAARGGQLAVLKWLHSKKQEDQRWIDIWCADEAQAGGHDKVIRWLRDIKDAP
ncbi:expressed unknown protein [Seminavis robusta]|uniref:Uncharacterized protein n=1 Tax=Seminavis robusta TaxID=568900 RepID=A0A9N8E191_9STRA|nr:expressed unknown protein [Seminavis robusta]|eukprot:Sro446_g144780.1 n/a (255) ;mRNA; r:60828-61592